MAAGLSGLYSSLAHTLKNLPHDWHAFTLEDCQRIDGIRPFLNSLEFCNAVAQVCELREKWGLRLLIILLYFFTFPICTVLIY